MQRHIAAIGFAALTFASSASAHARWPLDGKLKPRTDDTDLKSPPCGGAAVNESRRATLNAGETITVAWEETVQHTGSFRIAFSNNGDTAFDQNVLKDKIPDDQDDAKTPHKFTTSIKVPDVACDKCVVQLIQTMLDSHPEAPTYYYSCADVKIVKGGTSTGTDTGSASDDDDDPDSTAKPKAPKKLKVKVKAVK